MVGLGSARYTAEACTRKKLQAAEIHRARQLNVCVRVGVQAVAGCCCMQTVPRCGSPPKAHRDSPHWGQWARSRRALVVEVLDQDGLVGVAAWHPRVVRLGPAVEGSISVDGA